MSYESDVAGPVMVCASAAGKSSLPTSRGRFVGGPIVWDEDRRQFRDYDLRQPRPDELQVLTREQLDNYNYLSGIAYEEGLKAAILAWKICPQDIDLDFWQGPIDPKTLHRKVDLPSDPSGPMWRIIRPAGNPGTTLLQQYNVRPDLAWELPSQGKLEEDPSFAISMFREASYSPSKDSAATGLPYIYTGFSFGGIWHLRFPKWQYAELHRRVGGQWKLVSWKDWSAEDLYGDSYGNREIFVVVMCLDGAILIKSTLHKESWVYALPNERTRVPAAPILLTGNGGATYFGLHAIDFAQGKQNVLKARSRTDLAEKPPIMPTSVAVGGKLPGTLATAVMYGDDDREITSLSQISAKAPRFWGGIRLESTDGTRTPVVRLAGVDVAPYTTAPALQWATINPAHMMEVTGGWRLDVEERCVRQGYTIKLNNRSRAYDDWHGNRMVSLDIGRPGSEGAGEGSSWVDGAPRRRVTSLAQVLEGDRSSYGSITATLQTISLLDELDAVEIGWRPPLDGLTVAQAFRRILGWCNLGSWQLGEIYDSGQVLPSSSYALSRQLSSLPDDIRGALDAESGAACQLRADMTGLAALKWLIKWDYNTYIAETELGQISYIQPSTTSVRSFTENASAVPENEYSAVTFRARIGEAHTSIEVTGRERTTGRPLSASAADRTALLTAASTRFKGFDKRKRVTEENLIAQHLCAMRAYYEYKWMLRQRDGVSWHTIGQRLLPLWLVTWGGRSWYLTDVQETITATEWGVDVDAVSADG